MARYAMQKMIAGAVEAVRTQMVGALKDQGFGILTEIDVQQVFKEKLGLEFESYLLLGVCNPQFASQALAADRSLGLLLPCNVVLRQVGSQVEVSIADPEVLFESADPATASALAGLPLEVKRRLQAVLVALE